MLIAVGGSRVLRIRGLAGFALLAAVGQFLPVAWTMDGLGLDAHYTRTGREELRANLGAGIALSRFALCDSSSVESSDACRLSALWARGLPFRRSSPDHIKVDAVRLSALATSLTRAQEQLVGYVLLCWNWRSIKLGLNRFADHHGIDRRSMATSATVGTYAWILHLITAQLV